MMYVPSPRNTNWPALPGGRRTGQVTHAARIAREALRAYEEPARAHRVRRAVHVEHRRVAERADRVGPADIPVVRAEREHVVRLPDRAQGVALRLLRREVAVSAQLGLELRIALEPFVHIAADGGRVRAADRVVVRVGRV